MNEEQRLLSNLFQKTLHSLESLAEILDLPPEELKHLNSRHSKEKIALLAHFLKQYHLA